MFGLYCFITAEQRNSHLKNWIDPLTVSKMMTPWNICSIIEIIGHNYNYQCDMIWFRFGNTIKTDYVKFDYLKFNCHFLVFVIG